MNALAQIPRSPTWHSLVEQRRSQAYDYFAGSRGIARPVYWAGMDTLVRQWVLARQVRVRVRLDILGLVLGDGRLKSQFETASSGGAFNPALRIQTEAALFGILPRSGPDARPIYGYLEGSSEASVLQYGTVVLSLRDSVRDRTTFTMGDSLDHTQAGTVHCLAPEPLTNPTCAAAHTDYDLLDQPSGAHASGYGYIECQIHGGVELADIEGAVFTRGFGPPPEIHARLTNADIESRVEQGDEP